MSSLVFSFPRMETKYPIFWHTRIRCCFLILTHYRDVIMSTMATQITSVSTVWSIVCSATDQRNHQSSASLAFVGGIHRWPVNSPHKEPVTRKIFPFVDVIMANHTMKKTDLRNLLHVVERPAGMRNISQYISVFAISTTPTKLQTSVMLCFPATPYLQQKGHEI